MKQFQILRELVKRHQHYSMLKYLEYLKSDTHPISSQEIEEFKHSFQKTPALQAANEQIDKTNKD